MCERHYYRCCDCLTVYAVDGARLSPEAVCDLCDGKTEWMGRVAADRLVKVEFRCDCDDRCTAALGPKCNCKCGGKNHGASFAAYSRVIVDVGGVPRLTRPDTGAKVKAAEYRAALARAGEVATELATRKRVARLTNEDFTRLYRAQCAVRKARRARCHRTRMRILADYVASPAVVASLAGAAVQSMLFA